MQRRGQRRILSERANRLGIGAIDFQAAQSIGILQVAVNAQVSRCALGVAQLSSVMAWSTQSSAMCR